MLQTIVYKRIALFTVAMSVAKALCLAFPGKVGMRRYDAARDSVLGHIETLEVAKAVIIAAAKEEPVEPKKPKGHVRDCLKCSGSGIYVWGAIVNGRPSKMGTCFDCAGKGYQTFGDIKRDTYYHDHEPAY